VLSGPCGGIVSQLDSPMGGLGLSPAFPVGASLRVIRAHEPILVDFGTCYHGYQVDETRMFSIGKMDQKFIDAYKACREIHDAVLEEIRPGADCEAIFIFDPIVFPGEGSVGLENTVFATRSGYEILTGVSQDIFEVGGLRE